MGYIVHGVAESDTTEYTRARARTSTSQFLKGRAWLKLRSYFRYAPTPTVSPGWCHTPSNSTSPLH